MCLLTCTRKCRHKPFPVTRESSSQLLLTLPGIFSKLFRVLGTLPGAAGVVAGGVLVTTVARGGADGDDEVLFVIPMKGLTSQMKCQANQADINYCIIAKYTYTPLNVHMIHTKHTAYCKNLTLGKYNDLFSEISLCKLFFQQCLHVRQ